MARWLARLGLCCGLSVVITGGYVHAQKSPNRSDDDRNKHQRDDHGRDERGRDDHGRDERGRDDERRGSTEGRRSGPSRDNIATWWTFGWRRVSESARRDGGSLELLPMLLRSEVRKELGVDNAAFTSKLDTYMAELQKRFDDERKQLQGVAGTDWSKVFSERMAKENAEFQKFVDALTEEQRDRLIGLFVQARGYRSVSNQLVSDKLELNANEASKMREEIDDIREKVMHESRDHFRRIFDKGGDREEFEKLIGENQKKIDDRIKKILSVEQREKLDGLRGEEIAGRPEWLLRSVEMPRPAPLPRNDSRAAPEPQQASDSKHKNPD